MDGMAISVVEKERAGMATGIFNAVRVSADGIAIAIAGALLATFIQWGLFDALKGVSPDAVTEAANRAAPAICTMRQACCPVSQRCCTKSTSMHSAICCSFSAPPPC